MRKTFIRAVACAAAVVLTAGVPISVQRGAFSTSPASAYAEEKDYTEGTSGIFSYKKYSDHIEIWNCDMSATSADIPSSIEGLPVTVIDMYTFQGTKLKSVTIPDSVTTIGHWAFCMCSDLETVTIPDSVTSIGIRAFEFCSSLKTVNFPDHLVETSSSTFADTPWLEEQRKKDPLVIVNGAVIDAQTTKGDVVVPSGVKYVAAGAFARNDNVTSVVFPSTVSKICDDVFFYCSNLTSVSATGAESIGIMSFSDCNKLTELKLSNKLKKIDGYGFSDCGGTAKITFYGTKDDWDKVDKPTNDPFLNRANIVFDSSNIEPEEVMGDVNGDGKFDISDVVTFQKWLLRKSGATLSNWKNADFDGNKKLNVFDLCLMKKEYVNKK